MPGSYPVRPPSALMPPPTIAANGGDAWEAVKVLLLTTEFLEDQLDELRSTVPTGYARDGFRGPANARTSQTSDVTYYVALPFVFSDDGVAAGEAAECLSANAPVMRRRRSRKPGHSGASAFSRTGDPSSGKFRTPS